MLMASLIIRSSLAQALANTEALTSVWNSFAWSSMAVAHMLEKTGGLLSTKSQLETQPSGWPAPRHFRVSYSIPKRAYFNSLDYPFTFVSHAKIRQLLKFGPCRFEVHGNQPNHTLNWVDPFSSHAIN
ncbi:hypothetical protein VNO77_26810 [Canavalia gladiata]|uniref:Uncharacterized protein n=1 Tax=Canavalia gladiata TaxID=3824 RepID=A0AAN9KSX8_CANGL